MGESSWPVQYMLHGKVCLHQHYRLSQHTFLDKMVLLGGFERGGTKRLRGLYLLLVPAHWPQCCLW